MKYAAKCTRRMDAVRQVCTLGFSVRGGNLMRNKGVPPESLGNVFARFAHVCTF